MNNSFNERLTLENEKIFEAIFLKYYPASVFFANRLIHDKCNAEDLVTETFIKLWQKRAGFDNEPNVKAFLYITTRNASFNYLKSIQRQTKEYNLFCQLNGDREDHNVWNTMTQSDVLRNILELVESLPRGCRKIMRLRLIGHDNKDIATQLNVSIHTVKNQIVRGHYLLKKKVQSKNKLYVFLILVSIFNSLSACGSYSFGGLQ